MITEIIELLQKHHYRGAGINTEIAKGKNEIGCEIKKIKRWLLKRL
jgi:hypothetical protein